MRIALLTREFPPDTVWGGQAVGYYDLARGLAKLGHEVHVICQAVGGAREYCEEGVFVHRVGGYVKQWSSFSRIDYSVRAVLKLEEVIDRYRIEVVDGVSDGTDALLYSVHRQLPLVIQVHGSIRGVLATSRLSKARMWQLRVLLRVSDFLIRSADRVIAISPLAYNEVVEGLHVPTHKVRLLYLCRDIEEFHPVESDVRQEYGISEEDVIVLFVGRLERRKGVHVLCEAMPMIARSIPTAHFVFIGRDMGDSPDGGSFVSYIRRVAVQHGLSGRILLLDYVPREDLLKFYSASDVVVCPSLHEIASCVPIEAMACGKPVVATPTGIAGEFVDDTRGAIVPMEDPEALARETVRILQLVRSDPGVKSIIAKRSREAVERRCSISRTAAEVVEVYEEAMQERICRR